MTISTWSINSENTIDLTKNILSRLSLKVREDQLRQFIKKFKPLVDTFVLDVGVSPNENLPDTNYFEKFYPYPKSLVAVSVEDCSELKKRYPLIKIKKIKANKRLPFGKNFFSIVTSWATLEHVGGLPKQEFFLNELLRVGKHVYITTPYRWCFYEPHTGFIFLHWLPRKIFRNLCLIFGKKFWASEENLNPLGVKDIQNMKLIKKVNIHIYKIFGFIPSHLVITT